MRPEPHEPGQAVGEARLALAGGDDDHRAAVGTGVHQVLGVGGRLVDGDARLAQIRQLRMRAVRAQHLVGGAQHLPGGPGQQSGRDAVAGGEQDDAARGGGLGGGVGAGCVHPTNVTHAADRPGSYPQGDGRSSHLSTARPFIHSPTAPQTRPGAWPAYYVVCCVPVDVTSRSHGVFASTRLLFWTSQAP